MTADPAILKRIRDCPFARGGRVLVRFRANGYSLFARRSGEPLARLRLTGNGDEVVLLGPSQSWGSGGLHDVRARPLAFGPDFHQPQNPSHVSTLGQRTSVEIPDRRRTPNLATVPALGC